MEASTGAYENIPAGENFEPLKRMWEEVAITGIEILSKGAEWFATFVGFLSWTFRDSHNDGEHPEIYKRKNN